MTLTDREILEQNGGNPSDIDIFEYRSAVDSPKMFDYYDAYAAIGHGSAHADLPKLIYAGTQLAVCYKFGVGIDAMEAAVERCYSIIRKYNQEHNQY
jgi:hypothetical protein